MSSTAYTATVGLETHVQLRTRTKIWCGCENLAVAPPNTLVCPVCLGYPGALPVLNREVVRLIVSTGLMLNCRINLRSKFDRKNYFYPDQAKNYQISQFDEPFCENGWIDIQTDKGSKRIGITRIHQEEDVAKSIHAGQSSLVDFNRAGTPLMEIVTEPDFETPDEVFAYLTALKQILQYGQISDCNLENGNIRSDINCSVRPVGQQELGVKTEIKNMNTFRGVHRALTYEIQRQISVVKKGGAIVQETRRWDDDAGVTQSMRSKEYAHDYRYFPEPDLVPVVLTSEQVEAWRAGLPELPEARRQRFVADYGLPDYDARVLVADMQVADFFEMAAREAGNAKAVSNWVMTEVLRVLSEGETTLDTLKITPAALAELVKLVDSKTLNSTTAKEVFADMMATGDLPGYIVKAKGLAQVSDSGALEALVDEAIAGNPKSVEDYRAGKTAALQFLMGQVMRQSKGKANPPMVIELLKQKLG